MATSMLKTLDFANNQQIGSRGNWRQFGCGILPVLVPVLVPVILVADIDVPETLDVTPVAMAVPFEAAETALLATDAALVPVPTAEAEQLAAEGNVTLTLDHLLAIDDPWGPLHRRREGIAHVSQSC